MGSKCILYSMHFDTRVVDTEAKPVSIAINGGEIVYIEVDWYRSTPNFDRILSAQHVSATEKPKKEFETMAFATINSKGMKMGGMGI